MVCSDMGRGQGAREVSSAEGRTPPLHTGEGPGYVNSRWQNSSSVL